MSEKIWSDDAWEDYLYWQPQDKKTLKRINQLISDARPREVSDNFYLPPILFSKFYRTQCTTPFARSYSNDFI